jgi:hypothetical protein
MRERSWFLMHQQCGFALLQRHFSSALGLNDLWAEIHDRLDRVLAVSGESGRAIQSRGRTGAVGNATPG